METNTEALRSTGTGSGSTNRGFGQEMSTYNEYRRSTHLGGLDGLRAVAIAAVVAHHVGLGAIAAKGILGVNTFFAISGFLVTTILLREHDKTGSVSLRSFHVRRILRIWPLYFAVLGLYIILVALTERHTVTGARFFANLPYFLTFTANWAVETDGSRVIFFFAWSLATQEQFYLVWPSVIRFGRRASLPVILLLVLFVAEVVVSGAVATKMIASDAFLVGVFSRSVWSPICLGGILAFALHRPRTFYIVQRVAARRWSPPLAGALVMVGVWVESFPVALFRLCAVYLIAACVLCDRGPIRRTLDNPMLVRIGAVSYGIYLFHMLAVNVARVILPAGPPMATFAVALSLSILTAIFSYELFEKRFLALRRRFVPAAVPTDAVPQQCETSPFNWTRVGTPLGK